MFDNAMADLAAARRTIAWLRADRERIRAERDAAEVRMIEAETALSEQGGVCITICLPGGEPLDEYRRRNV